MKKGLIIGISVIALIIIIAIVFNSKKKEKEEEKKKDEKKVTIDEKVELGEDGEVKILPTFTVEGKKPKGMFVDKGNGEAPTEIATLDDKGEVKLERITVDKIEMEPMAERQIKEAPELNIDETVRDKSGNPVKHGFVKSIISKQKAKKEFRKGEPKKPGVIKRIFGGGKKSSPGKSASAPGQQKKKLFTIKKKR